MLFLGLFYFMCDYGNVVAIFLVRKQLSCQKSSATSYNKCLYLSDQTMMCIIGNRLIHIELSIDLFIPLTFSRIIYYFPHRNFKNKSSTIISYSFLVKPINTSFFLNYKKDMKLSVYSSDFRNFQWV